MHDKDDPEQFNTLNGVALVMLYMMQIGYEVTLSSFSSKLLLFVTCAGTWLLFTYYTSDLTARMTSGPPTNSIKSFHDIIAHNYRVVTQHSDSNHGYLKLSQKETPMNTYYYNSMHNNDDAYVPNIEAGAELMLSGDKESNSQFWNHYS
jgi:hypothetical protein